MPYRMLKRWPKVGEYVTFPVSAAKPNHVEGVVKRISSRTDEDGERRLEIDNAGTTYVVRTNHDEILISF